MNPTSTNGITHDDGAASADVLTRALDRLFRLDGEAATELLLVRHAEPDSHNQACVDSPLSSHGQWQAQRLAERLQSTPIDAIYASATRCPGSNPRARSAAESSRRSRRSWHTTPAVGWWS